MKTKRTNYIRVRSIQAINRLVSLFNWRLKNQTVGSTGILVELHRANRRLLVTSPL